ncbi:MAG: SRPBCC family protein [Caulobacteraceae bacterium]
MTIAPVRHSVAVAAPPERAFDLFVGSIGRWWPRGRTVGAKPHADIVIEQRQGGRWFERAEDGEETDWGTVSAIEPPRRLLLAWKLNAEFKFDPEFATAVELTFAPEGGGTRVTLEHRDLERFGAAAEKVAGQLDGGWSTILGHYADSALSPRTAAKELAQ